MKKYRLRSAFVTILMLLSVVAPFPARAIEAIDINAKYAILVDAAHGEILYDKNSREQAYPASITKVMTALLVIEAIEAGSLSLDTMVTCSDTAWNGLSIYGSTADIQPGEALSVEDLLYCLMLPSANEAANILAEAVSGDVEAFVALMNRRAGELNCEGTHFSNSHGLHDDDHYTTAYDIALFFAEAMGHEIFQTIVSTKVYETAATGRKDPRLYYNTNPLISTWYYTGYYYNKCTGGKTGTTPEAGGCLVSAAEDKGGYLISVVLGAETVTKEDGTTDRPQYSESQRLFTWGFKNFAERTISPGDDPVASITVSLSQEADQVLVRPDGSITCVLPVDVSLDAIESEIHLFSDSVEAPVAAGQLMGTITLSYEGTEYGTLDLVALNDVERSDFLYKKQQIIDFFQSYGKALLTLAVAVVILLTALRIAYVRKQRRRVGAGARKSSYSSGRRR